MKKKFNAFDIIGLGVISYLICIIFGLVSKHVFNLGDVDILSSSATLFAGVVALILFNDWREQYRTDLIFKLQGSISSNLTDFEDKFDKLYYAVRNANIGHQFRLNDILRSAKEMQDAYDRLLPDFFFLKKLLVQISVDIDHLSINPFDLEDAILSLIGDLIAAHLEYNDAVEKLVKEYWKILENNTLRADLKTVKYLMNHDLQGILLKNIS